MIKAIAKNPEARYRSVEEFGAALEHPESVAPTPPDAPDAPAPKRTVLESPTGATTRHGGPAPRQPAAPPPVTPIPSSLRLSRRRRQIKSRYMLAG